MVNNSEGQDRVTRLLIPIPTPLAPAAPAKPGRRWVGSLPGRSGPQLPIFRNRTSRAINWPCSVPSRPADHTTPGLGRAPGPVLRLELAPAGRQPRSNSASSKATNGQLHEQRDGRGAGDRQRRQARAGQHAQARGAGSSEREGAGCGSESGHAHCCWPGCRRTRPAHAPQPPRLLGCRSLLTRLTRSSSGRCRNASAWRRRLSQTPPTSPFPTSSRTGRRSA